MQIDLKQKIKIRRKHQIHFDVTTNSSLRGWIVNSSAEYPNELRFVFDGQVELIPDCTLRQDVVNAGYSNSEMCGFSVNNAMVSNFSQLDLYSADELIVSYSIDTLQIAEPHKTQDRTVEALYKTVKEAIEQGISINLIGGEINLQICLSESEVSFFYKKTSLIALVYGSALRKDYYRTIQFSRQYLNGFYKLNHDKFDILFIGVLSKFAINVLKVLDDKKNRLTKFNYLITKNNQKKTSFKNKNKKYSIAYDFTDFVKHIETNVYLTGIQRQQLVILIESSKSMNNSDICFYFDHNTTQFYLINTKKLIDCVMMLEGCNELITKFIQGNLRSLVNESVLDIENIDLKIVLVIGLPTSFLFETYLLEIARKTHANIIPIVHDLIPLEAPYFVDSNFYGKFFSYLKFIDFYCKKIYVVSEYIQSKLMSYLDGKQRTYKLVRPGANFFEYWQEYKNNHSNNNLQSNANSGFANSEINISSILGATDRKYCLCVGSNDFRKNYLSLTWIWELLWKKLGEATPFIVIVGGAGKIDDYFNSLHYNNSALTKRTILLTSVKDEELSQLYINASCILVPSLAEGFGLAVTEGLYYQKVVVFNNNSSLPEASGGGGVAVDFHRPLDVVDSILKAFDQRGTRASSPCLNINKWEDYYHHLHLSLSEDLKESKRRLVDSIHHVAFPGIYFSPKLYRDRSQGCLAIDSVFAYKGVNMIHNHWLDGSWNPREDDPIVWSKRMKGSIRLDSIIGISSVRFSLHINRNVLDHYTEKNEIIEIIVLNNSEIIGSVIFKEKSDRTIALSVGTSKSLDEEFIFIIKIQNNIDLNLLADNLFGISVIELFSN